MPLSTQSSSTTKYWRVHLMHPTRQKGNCSCFHVVVDGESWPKPGHQHYISLVDHTECKSFAASKTSWILCKVTHLDLCSIPVLGLDALTRGFLTSSCCESGMLNHALNFELWSFSSTMVCGMILAGSQSQYHEWNKLKHLIMYWRDKMHRVLQR